MLLNNLGQILFLASTLLLMGCYVVYPHRLAIPLKVITAIILSRVKNLDKGKDRVLVFLSNFGGGVILLYNFLSVILVVIVGTFLSSPEQWSKLGSFEPIVSIVIGLLCAAIFIANFWVKLSAKETVKVPL